MDYYKSKNIESPNAEGRVLSNNGRGLININRPDQGVRA